MPGLNRILPLAAQGLAVALMLAAVEGRSDNLAAEPRDFAVRTWSKADGLPDGSVTVIQQTQDGYLWVGTAAGLVRFDGLKFTDAALPKDGLNKPAAITALCEDSSGFLWIGTEDQGLFSWKDGRWQHFGTAEGLLDQNVTSLTLDAAGRLWNPVRRLHHAGRFAGQFGFQRSRRQIGHGLDHHRRRHVPVRPKPDQPVSAPRRRPG